jgi:hypothetical protein
MTEQQAPKYLSWNDDKIKHAQELANARVVYYCYRDGVLHWAKEGNMEELDRAIYAAGKLAVRVERLELGRRP